MIYKTILKWVAQIVFFLGSLGVLAAAILFFHYSTQLPDPSKLQQRNIAQTTKIFDRNNQLLYEVHGDINRKLVPLDQMPKYLKDAVIVTEDRDFYKHSGFNFKRMISAALQDITHRGYSQGASTITQQLIKNTMLTTEKSIARKIKELILSIEIEQMMSKDEILQIYLNEIPFGSTAYGVQAAAETYFGKDVKDLTLAESAVLAAIIQAPSYYSPYGNHTDELSTRHHWILDEMNRMGYIDQQQLDEAKTVQLTFKRKNEDIKAPHFVFYILENLAGKYSQKQIEEGGLNIVTTLDLAKQNKAQEIVKKYADKNGPEMNAHNAALVSIDPKNGQILAMVGSKDYFANSFPENCTQGTDCTFEPNVNVATAQRQPGSSFKPFVYAIGFMDKWFPGSTLFDLKTDFGGNYQPNNYDKNFRGPVTIRSALQNSLNIPAVKMLALVGLEKTIKIANDMGIESLNDPDRYGLSLVLGGGEVKLIELTNAYGVFANQGKYNPVTSILKITDNKNNVLEEWKEEDSKKNQKEIFNQQIAYMISNVLSDNVARTPTFGASSPLYFPDRPVAAKTGTTDEYRDGWTVGYTPSVVTGVWAGNNDNSEMAGESGVYVAAPIWNEYMHFILDNTPVEEFTKPEGIISITVDRYTNLKPINGSETVTDIGAAWQVPTEFSKDITVYKVCKANGKLADDSIPADLTETKTYRVVHSEMPDNPGWETPVRGWASNMGTPPPTEKCTLEQIKPTISITYPENNSTVNNSLTINTSVNAANGVEKIDFFLDGNPIGSVYSNPYSIVYNVSSLKNGQHFISVNLTDKQKLTASDTRNININNQADHEGPEISIISPSNTNLAASNFPLDIQIKASDSISGVNRVEYKINSSPYGSVSIGTNNIYSLTWNYPGTGNFILKIIAFDNANNQNSLSMSLNIN